MSEKLKMFFVLLLLLAPSVFAQCGVGSLCKTKVGVETCTPCPAGTACSQWTTSSGGLGAFYCQYTACLAEGAFCNNRVGKCCTGLQQDERIRSGTNLQQATNNNCSSNNNNNNYNYYRNCCGDNNHNSNNKHFLDVYDN